MASDAKEESVGNAVVVVVVVASDATASGMGIADVVKGLAAAVCRDAVV